MTNRSTRRLLALSLLIPIAAAAAYAGGDLAQDSSWQPVKAEAVRTSLEEYLHSADISPEVQTEVRDRWRTAGDQPGSDVLERLAQSLAKADENVAELVAFCSTISERGHKLPEFSWLADSETPELISHNMRLYLARWLVQQGYYDEAVSWTDGLTTEKVVAPEALLFYRAVALHQLVEADKADTAIGQLLEGQEKLPTRYQKLADLMRHDMEGLKDDSLDHISRRMNDVTRRLDYGHAGKQVRGVEDGIIASLDKLIKDLEDRANASSSSSSEQQQGGDPQDRQGRNPGDPEGIRSRNPASESRLARGKGAGDVKSKNIGNHSGWGDLPAKDREEAMQQISKEFPSHYRDIIEQYFRKLASDEEEK